MTHWKKLTNPNYLGVYALEGGKSLILTIRKITEENVKGTDGKEERCVVAHFAEPVKPMILNNTNMKMLEKLLKTPYIEQWAGARIEVESQRVKAFGDVVDALRIKNRLPQSSCASAPNAKCAHCGKDIAPIGNMDSAGVAKYTAAKYGKALCAACATEEAKRAHEEAAPREDTTEQTEQTTEERNDHENDEN